MKKKNILAIIIVSAFSLIGLVILQINWIINAAELREEQFNHRVSIALFNVGNTLSDIGAT